eukprot:102814-Heterocapsa_arctica.AAC.1
MLEAVGVTIGAGAARVVPAGGGAVVRASRVRGTASRRTAIAVLALAFALSLALALRTFPTALSGRD